MLDSYFQVILKNLPPNSALINEIVDNVKSFLVSKALLKGDSSTVRPLRHLRNERVSFFFTRKWYIKMPPVVSVTDLMPSCRNGGSHRRCSPYASTCLWALPCVCCTGKPARPSRELWRERRNPPSREKAKATRRRLVESCQSGAGCGLSGGSRCRAWLPTSMAGCAGTYPTLSLGGSSAGFYWALLKAGATNRPAEYTWHCVLLLPIKANAMVKTEGARLTKNRCVVVQVTAQGHCNV